MSHSNHEDIPRRQLPSFTRTRRRSVTPPAPHMSSSLAASCASPGTNQNEDAHRNPIQLPLSSPHLPPALPTAPRPLLQSLPPWRGFQPWRRRNPRQGALGHTWRDYDARRPTSPPLVEVGSSRPRETALGICSDRLWANQSGEGEHSNSTCMKRDCSMSHSSSSHSPTGW